MTSTQNHRANPDDGRKRTIGLVVPSFEDTGGVPTVAEFILRAISRRPDFQARVISLATSARDDCSLLIARPSTWGRGVVTRSGHCHGHDFVHVGAHAFVGGMTKVEKDVIPYGMVNGNPGVLSGINLVGLKRRGFDREAIHQLRAAYRMIFASEGTLRERVVDASQLFADEPLVQDLVRFISSAQGGLTLPDNVGNEE